MGLGAALQTQRPGVFTREASLTTLVWLYEVEFQDMLRSQFSEITPGRTYNNAVLYSDVPSLSQAVSVLQTAFQQLQASMPDLKLLHNKSKSRYSLPDLVHITLCEGTQLKECHHKNIWMYWMMSVLKLGGKPGFIIKTNVPLKAREKKNYEHIINMFTASSAICCLDSLYHSSLWYGQITVDLLSQTVLICWMSTAL